MSDGDPVEPIQYHKGDATRPEGPGQKFILHVVNNQGGWGRGFVTALSKRWRKPERIYRAWASTRLVGGNTIVPFELGQIQWAHVEPGITVVNMLAQNGYLSGSNPHPLDLDALLSCLDLTTRRIMDWGFDDPQVVMPRIGCGLGGATWEEIEPLILQTLGTVGIPVTVYDL